jgi:hypothetical protein
MRGIDVAGTRLLVLALKGDDWWNSLTKKEQKQYIAEHPLSKYAKKAKGADVKRRSTRKSKPKKVSKPRLKSPPAQNAINRVKDRTVAPGVSKEDIQYMEDNIQDMEEDTQDTEEKTFPNHSPEEISKAVDTTVDAIERFPKVYKAGEMLGTILRHTTIGKGMRALQSMYMGEEMDPEEKGALFKVCVTMVGLLGMGAILALGGNSQHIGLLKDAFDKTTSWVGDNLVMSNIVLANLGPDSRQKTRQLQKFLRVFMENIQNEMQSKN